MKTKNLIISIILLGLFTSINSCKKKEIIPEKTPIDVSVISTRTNYEGEIEEFVVKISPLEQRFTYVNFDIVCLGDLPEIDTIQIINFSDTIDLNRAGEYLVGNKSYVKEYKDYKKIFHIKIENKKTLPLEIDW